MAIRVKCPSCEESFDLVDTLIGRKVKCRHCQQPFVAAAEAPDDADLGAAIQDQPRRLAARARRDDDAEPPRRRGRRDDDRDDDRPRRRDRDDDRSSGTSWGWIVGAGIAVVLVVGGVAALGGVAILFFLSRGAAVAVEQPQAAIADVADQVKVAQADPPRFPDPIPMKELPPWKGPPKKEPFKDPFQEPVKKDVEDVAWSYAADPGPQINAPTKASESLSFVGNPNVVFPRTPSPFVAVRHGQFPNEGWQVFDLEKCKLTGQIQAKVDLEKEALSPDGKFLAGKGRGVNFQQSVINVHSVSDGGKIARTFTVETNAATLRWIDFLEGDHTLTYKTHGITAHFEVWNAAGQRVQLISLPGLLDERERMCLSPGRKYLAVADDKAIHIFQATSGKKVGLLRPPIGFSAYTGMAFSPDGQELAVYGSAFGASSQMLVYKLDRGELVVHHKFAKDVGTMVKHRFGYKGQPLEWIPDKSGWLMFGQMLIDYVSGAPVYDISWPAQEFSFFPRRFIGPDYVVATSKDAKGTRMGYLALPRDTIAKAVEQARGGGAAAPAELPAVKTGDVAGATVLPNAGGNVAWKVEPDPARKPKGALGQKPIALRGSAQNIQHIFFTGPDVAQAAVLDAFQPNALAERRQFRVDRFDLIKGDHLGTTELFALDLPANPFPGLPAPGNAAPLTTTDASPGGTRFAACRGKEPQRLDIWNLAEGKHLVAWKPHADKVEWCGFVDEDRMLTVGDGKLILWKLPSLKAEYIVEGYRGKPCFSANRKHVLLMNGTALELIEAATGQRLGRLDAPAGMTLMRLQSAGFSPDGKELLAMVVTAAGNQIVRWGLSSGAFKESMDAKLAPANAGVLWAGSRNVLAGNILFNWDLKAPIWQYTLPGPGVPAAGSPAGRHWFAVGTGKEGPSVLAAQTIPDAGASQLSELIVAGQVRRAVPPGTNFQLAVNGFAAAQNDIVATVTNNLKTAGYNAGAGGVTININAQETATGKLLDYEIRKVGKFGLPKGGKQMIKVAEKKVTCQLAITDAAGAILDKREFNFATPRAITFEGDNYQAELDRLMWNGATNFARSAMLPANLYRVEGQLQALPKMGTLKAGG